MPALDSKPIRLDDVVFFPNEGQTFLHNLDSGEYYKLNEVAGDVWELSDGTKSVADIIDELEGKYEVAREQLESDVLELLVALKDAGCLSE